MWLCLDSVLHYLASTITCAPEPGTNHVLFVFGQNLDRPGVSYCAKITHDDNAITNAIDIYDNCRYFVKCNGLSVVIMCKKIVHQLSGFEDGNVWLVVSGSIGLWVVGVVLQWSSAIDEFQQ